MKILLTLFLSLVAGTMLLYAQPSGPKLLMDGKLISHSTGSKTTDTVHIKSTWLKKAKFFVISFENMGNKIWKRNTWLENENVTDTEKYSYKLASPYGTVTITAATIRKLLKGSNILDVWTSLQPKNDRMMVRETRDLIYTIVID